jgi:hypothetical protein
MRVIGVNKNIQGPERVSSPKSTEKWCGGTFSRKKCGVKLIVRHKKTESIN